MRASLRPGLLRHTASLCPAPLQRAKWTGTQSLAEDDPEVMAIVRKEKNRQRSGLELIASEVRRGARAFLPNPANI